MFPVGAYPGAYTVMSWHTPVGTPGAGPCTGARITRHAPVKVENKSGKNTVKADVTPSVSGHRDLPSPANAVGSIRVVDIEKLLDQTPKFGSKKYYTILKNIKVEPSENNSEHSSTEHEYLAENDESEYNARSKTIGAVDL